MTIDPYVLLLWLNAKPNSAVHPTDDAAVARVVPEGAESIIINHFLQTASFGLVASANWNTNLCLLAVSSIDFKLGFSTAAPRGATVSYRLSTSGGSLSVTADSESATLTHNLNDATAAYFALPTWNTTVYVSSKAANSITFGFGNPPEEAGLLYYGRFNLSTSAVVANDAVTEDAELHKVTHSLNQSWVDAFYMPTWNTTLYTIDSTRDANFLYVGFNTPAPAGATLDAVTGVSVA
jgi:hypothetical protein